ncbi:MAG: M28 family peptidase [Bacteroidia bacterium]|nr:M28 family peptidase [Bacteroidia bacterium]
MNRLHTYLFILLLSVPSLQLWAQESKDNTSKEIETHLRFLASDELGGRATGTAGNNVASAYISAFFQSNGLQEVPGATGYYQEIPFVMTTPPKEGSIQWGDKNWAVGKDFIVARGKAGNMDAEAIFVGYGIIDEENGVNDYEGLDLKGKIVVANLGQAGDENPASVIQLGAKKREWVLERGGIGLIELYRLSRIPWQFVTRRLNRARLQISNSSDISSPAATFTHIWAEDKGADLAKALKENKGTNIKIEHEGVDLEYRGSRNVLGWVEGTDPNLKNEYLLVTAHFDHVGTGPSGGRVTETDSIFNGARDNAIGTVSLMTTAKLLAANPPKRSVLFLAVTGEEMGMLGSSYYANNPLLPLNTMVFNLNCDGAGYNDKTLVSVVGFNHVDVEPIIKQGAEKNGLIAAGDPVPEQNLYDRSDNVSFASKGIPAINVSPGTKAFDAELMKYYHQVADEAESIDFVYISKFVKSFAEIASILANSDETPTWRDESKYFKAGKALYGED